MQIYTSYFYKVRFFPKNLIGLSTAVWPPKYELKNRDKEPAIWLDISPLKPGKTCEGLCNGKCIPKNPELCLFMREYENQLRAINFDSLIKKFQLLHDMISEDEGFQDVDFALLVHEAPQNNCSERIIIQKWFRENGLEIKEWNAA